MSVRDANTHPVVWALVLLVSMAATSAPSLQVERSPMVQRASGAHYEGTRRTGMSMERLSQLRASEYWTGVTVGDTVFFESRELSEAGLSVFSVSQNTWTVYPMFGLAIASRWYTPSAED